MSPNRLLLWGLVALVVVALVLVLVALILNQTQYQRPSPSRLDVARALHAVGGMNRLPPTLWWLWLAVLVLAIAVLLAVARGDPLLQARPRLLARGLLYTGGASNPWTWLVALSVMLLIIGIVLVIARNDALLRQGHRPARYAHPMHRLGRLLIIVTIVGAALAFIARLAKRG